MAREAILKGILNKVGLKTVKRADSFSVIRIEKMLRELDIYSYEFIYEAKVVKLKDKDELTAVLYHLMPSVSDSYHLALNEFAGKAKLRVGGWQFEAQA